MTKAKAHSQTNVPFDRTLVRKRRARGHNMGGDNFLYARTAEDMAARVLDVSRNFEHVLILGNAELGRLVASKVADKLGHVVYADHSIAAAGLDVICDEEALPFKPGNFDLVLNLLSLHGVNQVPQALMSMRKLLKPDGLFIGSLFGGGTLGELRHVLYAAEDELYGRVSPRISSMIRLDQATALLSAGGFTLPVADRDVVVVKYTKLSTLYQDLRRMGETNILSARAKTNVSRRFFAKVEQIYRSDHSNEAGKFKVRFETLWLTGWAPHPDQPKPLKPGSATTTLADALGVKEEKL